MIAKPISVKELLGKRFNIPYYQRGYRWEEKQVNDLLNDLQEFYFKIKANSDSSFYCLQPLVVVKNKQLTTDEDNPVYDLIDGQQRLTTLYLLLVYFKSIDDTVGDLYELRYERLEDSGKLFDINNLRELTDESKELLRKHNDFVFLFKAYQTIVKWFTKEEQHLRWSILRDVILGDGTSDHNQNDVRFLWYEPDQEVSLEDDAKILRGSITIFNRLNYGQTPLSNTDLIKAMIMICDIYPPKDQAIREEESSRYASEWDMIEKRLHDRLLWSMLVSVDYRPLSRMELLFDYVAHELYERKNVEESWEKNAFAEITEDESDFSYRVVSAYLLYSRGRNIDPDEYKKRVAYVWKCVQRIYHMFCNWYNNRKTYHLIGLYVLLHEKQLGGEIVSRYKLLKELTELYTKTSRDEFAEELKMKIGEKIKIRSKAKDSNRVEHEFTLETINYSETPRDLIRILTLFNVEQTMNELAENIRFDFALFKRTNPTSLEHIHPQHLRINDNDLLAWYNRRKEILTENKRLPVSTTTDPQERELLVAISYLDKTLNKSLKDDKEKSACESHLAVIDQRFDELADINEIEMHTIKNMALVDGSVNSALSNKLLHEKREVLFEKSEERDKDNYPEHYIMIGTKKVFNKLYTPKERIIDLKFWGKDDRNAYFKRISEVYDKYVK